MRGRLARLLVVHLLTFLARNDVNLVGFTHLVESEVVDLFNTILNFVCEVEHSFVIMIQNVSGPNGLLRAYFLDEVVHLSSTNRCWPKIEVMISREERSAKTSRFTFCLPATLRGEELMIRTTY